MTPEEREWMNQLCTMIQTEADPEKFSVLVKELDELLEKKERRIAEQSSAQPRCQRRSRH